MFDESGKLTTEVWNYKLAQNKLNLVAWMLPDSNRFIFLHSYSNAHFI